MKWKFLWVSEDYDVRGTNDPAHAAEISKYESVIDVERGVVLRNWEDAPVKEQEIPALQISAFRENPND